MSCPNARFNEWVNGGWVTLTIRPGCALDWSSGGAHEEGWSYNHITWRLEGGLLSREMTTEARDCDGRHTHYSDTEARIEDIDSERRPAWNRVGESQRDYAAEAAGY